MMPYLRIFGRDMPTYGIMAAIGLLLCMLLCWLLCRRNKREEEQAGADGGKHPDADVFLSAAVPMLIGFLIGAHLLHALTQIPAVIEILSGENVVFRSFADFWNILSYLFGGMVFYGGFAGVITALCISLRKQKAPILPYLDLAGVLVPFFHAFGRVGCFLAGCCYGIECEHGIAYPAEYFTYAENVPRFPVQLLEAALNLLLFGGLLLVWMFLRKRMRGGSVFRLYLVGYGFIRFFDEYLRADAVRGVWFGLSTSQWIALAAILFAVVWYVADRAAERRSVAVDS
jgi:phosphatidylglycerol:prolipoprotein diacylglycerol transferase